MKRAKWIFLFKMGIFLSCCQSKKEWPEYLGNGERDHFSPSSLITHENVNQLKPVWTYSLPDSGQIQANALMVDGVVYGVSPTVQVFALDAETGKEKWRFGDPINHWSATSRGVTYWEKGADKRILFTAGPTLWALHAETGMPVNTFGKNGQVDLHLGLPPISKDKFIISNTPGTLFEDLLIMPVRVSEGVDAAPGDIRAFDVVTGRLVWTFHTIPHPGEFGYETVPKDAYTNREIGGANNWAGMAIDRDRGIVYVPTGSMADDFYGGNRPGRNLFANCLLALDARTGKRLWHFQTTHHDIWDRDLPAPPVLATISFQGKKRDIVAQISKQGYVYVFDRVTGEPLFPMEERKVPRKGVPGEVTWPTQPFPKLPLPFSRQSNEITKAQISPFAPNRTELQDQLATLQTEVYHPGTETGTLLLPGYDGGAEWGGAAIDRSGVLYVNSNEMAWILKLEKTKNQSAKPLGALVYEQNCSSCHGPNQKGGGNVPSLVQIKERLTQEKVHRLIRQGKGMMPGFPQISEVHRNALVSYLWGSQDKQEVTEINSTPRLPYKSDGYHKFLDSRGLPAISPPWGQLTAIDLTTGKFKWQIPLGFEPLIEKETGRRDTGVENYGGPVVTASGILFIAATKDGYFRAFDTRNGHLLWEYKLPAAGFATPTLYEWKGKPYLVIACGGTKLGTPKGNQYVAFGL